MRTSCAWVPPTSPALLWSFADGKWWIVDRARPAVAGKDAKSSKPAVTTYDIIAQAAARLAFARRYNPAAAFMVTTGKQDPNTESICTES